MAIYRIGLTGRQNARLGGRTTLWSSRSASHIDRASSRLKDQWAFKHLARNLPLNNAQSALFVGFPGLEKLSFKPFICPNNSSPC